MRAVPRVGMKPGERLVPLREIKSEHSRLMAEKPAWPEGADAAGPLLAVKGITKSFQIRKTAWFGDKSAGKVLAVDDVSFEVRRGECLGLVGESGCGKTTLSKILLRALKPDSGSAIFNDHGTPVDMLALEGNDLIRFRRQMQYVFQDPFGSLNPRMTVLRHPGRAADHSRHRRRRLSGARWLPELMRDGRPRSSGILSRYPHSFSGGQRQRIGIARALALQPRHGDLRRAGLGPRRVDPGTDPEPA